MSSDVLANFSCLDELTQVIYQGVYQFVVISTVSDQWILNVGLSGPEGRWWRGSWTKTDILDKVGSKSSDKLLETFGEKLAETLIQGDLHVGDWDPEEGAKIKLTFGPTAKKPVHIPLVEITSAEAASYATGVFLDIALHAQSRKCRLHPDQYASTYVSPAPRAEKLTTTTVDIVVSDNNSRPVIPIPHRTTPSSNGKPTAVASGSNSHNKETRTSKAAPEKPKQIASTDLKTTKSVIPKPLKGASLANPNKKARKYQAIEFESDDE